MKMQSLPRKSALACMTIACSLSLAAPQAHAGSNNLSDNVRNIAGGGVNVAGGEACVDKVGDTKEVEYLVQHQPIVTSSDHVQTSPSGYIAVPKALKNVSIELEAVGVITPEEHDDEGNLKNNKPGVTPIILSQPAPIALKDANQEGLPFRGASLTRTSKDIPVTEGYIREQLKSFFMEKVEDIDSPELFPESFNSPFSINYRDSSSPWYGNHNKDYDLYVFGNTFFPATFKVKGELTATQEDNWFPLAASNIGWRMSEDGPDGGAGSYEQGAQSLQDFVWGRVGYLPPVQPTDEGVLEAYRENNSIHGLDINPLIAPTREVPGSAKYTTIGGDIRQSPRGDIGEVYARTFSLHDNPRVTYSGQVPISSEDGADIAAWHIDICSDTPDTPQPSEPGTTIPNTPKPSEPSKPGTTTPDAPKPSEPSKPGTPTPDTPKPSEPSKPGTTTPNTSQPSEPSKPGTTTPDAPKPSEPKSPAQSNPRSLASGATPAHSDVGPTVDTGGAVHASFFDKVLSLLR